MGPETLGDQISKIGIVLGWTNKELLVISLPWRGKTSRMCPRWTVPKNLACHVLVNLSFHKKIKDWQLNNLSRYLPIWGYYPPVEYLGYRTLPSRKSKIYWARMLLWAPERRKYQSFLLWIDLKAPNPLCTRGCLVKTQLILHRIKDPTQFKVKLHNRKVEFPKLPLQLIWS
jgi:hypothetical protein